MSKTLFYLDDQNMNRLEYCELYAKKSGLNKWKVLKWESYDDCEVTIHTGPDDNISFDIGDTHFSNIKTEVFLKNMN